MIKALDFKRIRTWSRMMEAFHILQDYMNHEEHPPEQLVRAWRELQDWCGAEMQALDAMVEE